MLGTAINFTKGETAYLVGIGGIGMSALAQFLHHRGVTVLGSDREPSPATRLLNRQGIDVYIGHDVQNMPEAFDVLVYSDAVPATNNERAQARERGIPELSYFEALGNLSRGHFTIAVAGSHGKTTTTAMLAKMLIDQDIGPTAVVGSIMKDYESNFVVGKPDAPLVVEACEYKDHFLELSPNILVVTNLEWDHTDYFTSFDQLKDTFRKAIEKLPEDGTLVLNLETPIGRELAVHAPCSVVNYADMAVPELPLLGKFNAMNAATAKTAALAYDPSLSEAALDASLKNFQGTWRRFEFKGTTAQGASVYDDYAHHPTEIITTIRAVRQKFPGRKIVVAFHPHLYSRTRDLGKGFVEALSAADEVVLAPIYAAREEPIEGVSSDALARAINDAGGSAIAVSSLEAVPRAVHERNSPEAIIITMGAGDIYKIVDQLVQEGRQE